MEYSFKDIISSYRSEYLKIREELIKLEKNINILDLELSKCRVLLDNNNKEICLYFFQKEKNIIDAIIRIQKEYNVPIISLENLEYNTSVNTFYHFKNDLKHFHIIIEDINAFNNNCLKILGMDFINKVEFKEIQSSSEDSHILEYNNNCLSQDNNKFDFNISSITYYPYRDFIKINYLKNFNKALLEKELNIKYRKNKFNLYEQELIENNRKDIVLFDDDNSHEFKIEEEDKRLVLVKS